MYSPRQFDECCVYVASRLNMDYSILWDELWSIIKDYAKDESVTSVFIYGFLVLFSQENDILEINVYVDPSCGDVDKNFVVEDKEL